ncbi:MAG: dihydroxyacetone kinase subunit DhaL [Firmicutes bacterium]|jgi:dihydroxyacetone kinase-like protein|nr:dihydroxyacetone kinase subunit DhaL [Bacillota bacterium]
MAIIKAMAEAIRVNKDYLTELDAAIGDADHGVNMDRGFQAVLAKLDALTSDPPCVGTILSTVGMTLVSTVGGASGPLYGTAFLYAGNVVKGKDRVSLDDAIAMLEAALAGIKKRGGAEVGDKTMVDALEPAVAYLRGPGRNETSLSSALSNAAAKAREGMESTRPIMAVRGRASFLKERSIGHLDPGAVSCYLLLKTIADSV